MIELEKTDELISKILSEKAIILNLPEESEAEGCFETLFSFMYALGDNNEAQKIIRDIIASLTDSKEKSVLRLKALTSLFNLTFSGDSKFEVVLAIFAYALETEQSNQITHFYAKYEDWSTTWSLGKSQQTELLKSMTFALQQEGLTDIALAAMTKLFNTCKDDKYSVDVEELISKALLSAIQSPISAFADRAALLEV